VATVGAWNSPQEGFRQIARHSREQCSIGFQPVFFCKGSNFRVISAPSDVFQLSAVPSKLFQEPTKLSKARYCATHSRRREWRRSLESQAAFGAVTAKAYPFHAFAKTSAVREFAESVNFVKSKDVVMAASSCRLKRAPTANAPPRQFRPA
jgi:hypothetical protein